MIDLKRGAVVSGAAFALSMVLGFIGGADLPSILLRAFFFAALGFGFVAVAGALVSRFLPELAGGAASADFEDEEGPSYAAPDDGTRNVGSNVDLSVGDEEGDALPYAAREEGVEGNPERVALDQGLEGGYTKEVAASSAAAARPPELVGDVDVLPDLEGLSDSFVAPISVSGGESESGRGAASFGESAGGDGKFDAKEMAMAIQTILKREEKG